MVLIKNISIHNRFDAYDAVTSCVASEFNIYLESGLFSEEKKHRYKLQAKRIANKRQFNITLLDSFILQRTENWKKK